MKTISPELRQYLSSIDSLTKAQLIQAYPHLKEELESVETQEALASWLAGDDPWEKDNTFLTTNVLGFMRAKAREEDATTVKSLLLHENALVRLRAYEYLLTLYFPDKNREAMFMLFHNMISDPEDSIRIEAVSYIQRANAIPELRKFLERWLSIAEKQHWEDTESYERVEGLLKTRN